MKRFFEKELLFFKSISTLNIKDINIGGIIVSAFIVIIGNNNIRLMPFIGSMLSLLIALILTILISSFIRKVSIIEMRKFLTLQITLLFLLVLVILIFPLKLLWLKVFLSIYIIYNFLICTFSSIYKFIGTK